MNESDLERTLRDLRPSEPSQALENWIEAELNSNSSFTEDQQTATASPLGNFLARLVRGLGWAGAGAAAALIAIAVFPQPDRPQPPDSTPAPEPAVADGFERTETTRELLATEDDGLRYEESEGPVRQVRFTYSERHAWSNPRTGARVELEVPREDVFLMPVSMQ